MTWSPSEDRLAFIDTTCGPTIAPDACSGVLKTIARDGADQVALAESISAGSELVWNGDGHQILARMMNVDQGGGAALVIVHADRSPALVSRLTFDPTDSDPRWAPGHVLFVRPREKSSVVAHDAWWVRTDLSDEMLVASDVNGVDWRAAQ